MDNYKNILQHQRQLFLDFAKKYGCLIRNIEKINPTSASLLAEFNRDFQVTIDELDILNTYLTTPEKSQHKVQPKIQQKIAKYESMNDTINQFLPYIIVADMAKKDSIINLRN